MTQSRFDIEFRARATSEATQMDQPIETAWHVLDAAHDLDDDGTVAACRRVIDAILNGIAPSPSDLHVVVDYFR